MTDVKAKLVYCGDERIYKPAAVLVVNRNKANNIIRHLLILSIHDNVSEHKGHLILVTQVGCRYSQE